MSYNLSVTASGDMQTGRCQVFSDAAGSRLVKAQQEIPGG